MTQFGIKNYNLEIARGNVPGLVPYHKFGEAPDIDTGDGFVDLWDGGGLSTTLKQYTYSTTADIDHISSSNAGDTFDVEVQGLDTNWAFITQTVTLNGQTPVALSTSLIRVFRMKNISGTAALGDIYCYVGSTVTSGVPSTITDTRAVILQGQEQTLMALFTIPAGYTGYLSCHHASQSKKTSANSDVHLLFRTFNGVFRIQYTISISSNGSSLYDRHYDVPIHIPEKTDIVMRADTDTNNIGVEGSFDLILSNQVEAGASL